jgi:hypothetical protein
MNNGKHIEELMCAKKFLKLLIKRIEQIRGDFSSNGTATDELRSIVDGTPGFIKEAVNKELNVLIKSYADRLCATEKAIELINIINNHKDNEKEDVRNKTCDKCNKDKSNTGTKCESSNITVVICDSIAALEEVLKD